MSKSPAIEIKNLSKLYKRKVRSFKREADFFALRDLTLTINKGDRLGIIGRNGAGKSTLLKILSRIVIPTAGEVVIHGRLNSLLEVGIGFDPELTGRENIALNGSLIGLSASEVNAALEEIVEFSGLNDFIDSPVKHLSSGMYSRLAFSVAVYIPGDILAIDEVLSVGDMQFRDQALKKMNSIMQDKSRTIIFVSHNTNAIARFCDRVLWLETGSIKEDGEPTVVLEKYLKEMRSGVTKVPCETGESKSYDVSAVYRFDSIRLLDPAGEQRSLFKWSEEICIEMKIVIQDPKISALKGFHLHCQPRNGVPIDTHVFAQISNNPLPEKNGVFNYLVKIPANFLASGHYYITPFIISIGVPIIRHQMLERHLSFSVIFDDPGSTLNGDRYYGVINPALEWREVGESHA